MAFGQRLTDFFLAPISQHSARPITAARDNKALTAGQMPAITGRLPPQIGCPTNRSNYEDYRRFSLMSRQYSLCPSHHGLWQAARNPINSPAQTVGCDVVERGGVICSARPRQGVVALGIGLWWSGPLRGEGEGSGALPALKELRGGSKWALLRDHPTSHEIRLRRQKKGFSTA
jgi:hypothetical protein